MPNESTGGAQKARRIDHFVAPLEETPIASVDAVSLDEKPSNLWTDAWRDLRKRPMFWISGVLILVIIAVALFPGLFTSVDPASARSRSATRAPETAACSATPSRGATSSRGSSTARPRR